MIIMIAVRLSYSLLFKFTLLLWIKELQLSESNCAWLDPPPQHRCLKTLKRLVVNITVSIPQFPHQQNPLLGFYTSYRIETEQNTNSMRCPHMQIHPQPGSFHSGIFSRCSKGSQTAAVLPHVVGTHLEVRGSCSVDSLHVRGRRGNRKYN